MLRGIVAAVAAVALVGAGVSTASAASPAQGRHLDAMPAFAASQYVAQARSLPAGLRASVTRDLGISPEQYLADAAATVAANGVLDALHSAGISVRGSQLDGTELTVWLASEADRREVEALGVAVRVGAQPQEPVARVFAPAASVYAGQGYYWQSGPSGYQCSVAFPGFRASDGADEFLTAGHCLTGSPQLYAKADSVAAGVISSSSQLAGTFATGVASSIHFGGGADVSAAVPAAGVTSLAQVATYGNGSGQPLASTPLHVTGQTTAIVGSKLCKSGSRTGWSCGTVLAVDQSVQVSENGATTTVNSVISTACVQPGDSGGAAVIGSLAVGIVSTTSVAGCGTAGYESGVFPLRSAAGKTSVATALGTSWQLRVWLDAPVITAPAAGTSPAEGAAITGTVAASATAVQLRVDGAAAIAGTATPSSGSWSYPLSSLVCASGQYTVHATASSGRSTSAPSTSGKDRVTVTLTAAGTPFTGTAPTISGVAKVGARLTASAPAFSPEPTSVSYTWLANGVVVGRAATLTVPVSAFGATIVLRQTASCAGIADLAESSVATAKVAAGTGARLSVTTAGTRRVGSVLTARWAGTTPLGAASLSGTAVVWKRDGRAITGATRSAYRLTAADLGHRVTASVTANVAGFEQHLTATSATPTTTAKGFITAQRPTIRGTATPGRLLTAVPRGVAPAGATYTYRWRVDGKAIRGATHRTYRVTRSRVGHRITVTVTAHKPGYVPRSTTSTSKRVR